MNKNGFYRSLQLFVILGLPLLGFVYAYQFVGMDRGEKLEPFKTFKAPQLVFSKPGLATEQSPLRLQSKVTVVNFWATWCPPCVEEFPAMIELQRLLEEKGVELVFVSVDEKWENVDKFFKENGINVKENRLFWDPSKQVASSWGSSKFPETYVLRPDGWVVEKIIGAQQWTRPSVVSYFSDLAEKFSKIQSGALSFLREPLEFQVSLMQNLFVPQALAQSSKKTADESPLRIHEDDQKTLDKLRQNIETASKNLRMSEAAIKEEERNLEEQKVILEQKTALEKEAGVELGKLQGKMTEVEKILKRNRDQKRAEQSEKAKLESRIATIQANIAKLEARLKEERDSLVIANQDLGTRTQAIDTLSEAETSSQTEIGELQERIKKAGTELQKRQASTQENRNLLKEREKKLASIKGQARVLEDVLEKQKKTLNDFEKILKK